MNPKSAKFIHIVAVGATGGLLAWLIAATYPGYFESKIATLEFFKFLLGGGAAAVVGVYILANTDTSNFPRSAAFSLICGLSWSAVLDTGLSVLQSTIHDRPVAEMSLEIKHAREQIEESPDEETVASATEATVKAVKKMRAISGSASSEVKEQAEEEANLMVEKLAELNQRNPNLVRKSLDKLSPNVDDLPPKAQVTARKILPRSPPKRMRAKKQM